MQISRTILAASLSVLALANLASAAAITAGNLVIYRVGDGSAALGTTATAVFLDEYTTSGTLVQSIAVPTTGTSAMTAVGNSTTEGLMSLSQDKGALVFTGYRKDAGGTSPSADTGAITNRVIGRVGLAGVVDTSIALNEATVTSNIRSATTVDGSTFYIANANSVRYVGAPSGASSSVVVDARNSRQVMLMDNVLYASNGSTSITSKVQHYGTLPTGATAPTAVASLALTDAVNGIWLADLSSTVAGADTLYAMSTVENLIRKYTFDGTLWNATGSMSASGTQDITGAIVGGNVQLFVTNNTTIRTVTDSSGYGGSLAGSLTTIATAGANTNFRGLGILPEPTSLVGLAGVSLIVRRRRD